MLALTRENGQSIILSIGDERVQIRVTAVRRGKVRLAVTAARAVKIDREEIWRVENVGVVSPEEKQLAIKQALAEASMGGGMK